MMRVRSFWAKSVKEHGYLTGHFLFALPDYSSPWAGRVIHPACDGRGWQLDRRRDAMRDRLVPKMSKVKYPEPMARL
eukprot:4415983-Pyramimonas_sp.AAC.1